MSATASSKWISLMNAVWDCISLQNWHALKTTVSHRNLLFLAERYFVRHTSELESKISASQSQQRTILCITKLNHTANRNVSWFFRRVWGGGPSWEHRLLTTGYSSPPGANDTASQPDGVLPVLRHQSGPVINPAGWGGHNGEANVPFDVRRPRSSSKVHFWFRKTAFRKSGMWLRHIAKLFLFFL